MNILVTGAAGFIGAALAKVLLERGDSVVGIDNLNDYYDVNLKLSRLAEIEGFEGFSFLKLDISNREAIKGLFENNEYDVVVNLAAQAGVRYSIENPAAYIDSNLVGFANVIEGCRQQKVANLVYASSSSVYGANKEYPFNENHPVNHPVSLYAATKKSNELMAHSYSSLYDMSVTGLRFFTVYGPSGRPDMAPFLFTDKILRDKKIQVFNNGDMFRDFTYIDDIVTGIIDVIDNPATKNENWNPETPEASTSYCAYRILNIGNDKPTKLMDFIKAIEKASGKKAQIDFKPMQPGDVVGTAASIIKLNAINGFQPKTDINEGIKNFVGWFKNYYKV
ncbi:MAG: UDP-glucuronate 4-epimerase [Psychroserpens sp.]|jgi:UDP-glucuronate 4-epimerase